MNKRSTPGVTPITIPRVSFALGDRILLGPSLSKKVRPLYGPAASRTAQRPLVGWILADAPDLERLMTMLAYADTHMTAKARR